MSRYDSLDSSMFASEYESLWKKGMNATVELTLKDNCNNDTFCLFLQDVAHMTEPVTLVGTIVNTTSVLEGPMNNIIMSSFSSLNEVYLQMLIDYNQVDHTTSVRMILTGELILISETSEVLLIKSNITYASDDSTVLGLSGYMLGIYENLFGLDDLLDLVEVSATGEVSYHHSSLNSNLTIFFRYKQMVISIT